LPANAPAAALIQAVPFEVNTLLILPGAIETTDPVPLPTNTLLAGKVTNPVPPCAAVIAVDTLLTVTLFKAILPNALTVPPKITTVFPMVVVGIADATLPD